MAEILKNRIQFAVEGENKVITAQKKIADSAKKTAKSLEIFSKEVIFVELFKVSRTHLSDVFYKGDRRQFPMHRYDRFPNTLHHRR